MDGIRTIVFDLDGTIYQNFTFHRDYIAYLVEGTDKASWRDGLIAFTEDILAGRRLKMNAFYRNAALCANDTASLSSYCDALDGAYAPEVCAADFPPKNVYTYLGDAWAVVTLIGQTLALFPGDRSNEVYKKTRLHMEALGMHGNPALRAAILNAGKRFDTVLLSNSYEATALEFLKQLGFDGVFGKMGFSADKPYGLVAALRAQCPDALNDPSSVLAIGDHAYNDLLPLAALGCKTLWINPYDGVNEAPHDDTVKTLDGLCAYIDALRA